MKNYLPFEICIASSGLGHVTRGIESWATDLTNALRERGVPAGCLRGAGQTSHPLDSTLGCSKRSSLTNRTLVAAAPRRLSWRFGLGSTYAWEQTTYTRRLIQFLEQHPVRILHVQDPLVAQQANRAIHRRGLETRVILGHGTEEPLHFLKKLPFVQHLAPWHLEQAEESLGRISGWTALPNFVDTEQFSPSAAETMRDELGIPDNAFVVLCAAAIKKHHKRIDYLLNEFEQLAQSNRSIDIRFVIAGAREQDTNELMSIGRSKLGARIKFVVGLERSKMPELMRTADLFTLGSLYEMMPIALLEAIATGLPCLTHDHPILRWMTGAGGVTTDLNEPGAWARACQSILSNPERRKTMQMASREHCLAEFSVESVVPRILEYYRQVLNTLPSDLDRRAA